MVITDVDIPFGRMVVLILKVMIAAIPALILLGLIYMIIFGSIAAIMSLG